MSNGNGPERRAPVMPHDVDERSAQAWHMANEARSLVDGTANSTLEMFGKMMAEMGRNSVSVATMGQQIDRLTRSVRLVRKQLGGSSDEAIRDELPTLPEIIIEEVNRELRRDSDRAAAQNYRLVKRWIFKGIGKAVAAIVSLAIMAAAGYLARDIFGPHARVVAHEAVPR